MSTLIENQSKQFNNLIKVYRQTYNKFVNAINSKSVVFDKIPNSTFLGKRNISNIRNTTVNKCLQTCKTNPQCSGATFDNRLNTCNLISGNGDIMKANNKTAIVKQALYYSYQLKKLNEQLKALTISMIRKSNSFVNNVKSNKKMSAEKSVILQKNYSTLTKERTQIEKLIKQYESINSSYENGSIIVTRNYYNYIIYSIIVIFLVVILFNTRLSSEQVGGGSSKINPYLIGLIASIVILTNAILKN